MKTKYIIPIILLMLSTMSIAVNASVTSPIDLGIIDYQDYDYVNIESSTGETNLSYINSDITISSITLEKIEYYPLENETKYKITSNNIDPEPGFVPQINKYYYQDSNNGQIYRINIDHTGITPPLSNTQIQLMNLLTNYSQLETLYNHLFTNYTEQNILLDSINTTLSNYSNVSGINLAVQVNDLMNEHLLLQENLDKAYSDIQKISGELSNITMDYQDIQTLYEELMINHGNLETSYNELNSTYNETYNRLLEVGTNLSEYKNFVQGLTGYSNRKVYFKGRTYMPFSYYQNEIKELTDKNNMTPAWVFLSGLITFLICFVIARKYVKNSNEPFDEEIDLSEKQQKYNLFWVKDKLQNVLHLNKRIPLEPIEKTSYTAIETNKPDNGGNTSFETRFNDYKQEINQEIDKLDNKIETSTSDITNKIDQLLQQNNTPTNGGKK